MRSSYLLVLKLEEGPILVVIALIWIDFVHIAVLASKMSYIMLEPNFEKLRHLEVQKFG